MGIKPHVAYCLGSIHGVAGSPAPSLPCPAQRGRKSPRIARASFSLSGGLGESGRERSTGARGKGSGHMVDRSYQPPSPPRGPSRFAWEDQSVFPPGHFDAVGPWGSTSFPTDRHLRGSVHSIPAIGRVSGGRECAPCGSATRPTAISAAGRRREPGAQRARPGASRPRYRSEARFMFPVSPSRGPCRLRWRVRGWV